MIGSRLTHRTRNSFGLECSLLALGISVIMLWSLAIQVGAPLLVDCSARANIGHTDWPAVMQAALSARDQSLANRWRANSDAIHTLSSNDGVRTLIVSRAQTGTVWDRAVQQRVYDASLHLRGMVVGAFLFPPADPDRDGRYETCIWVESEGKQWFAVVRLGVEFNELLAVVDVPESVEEFRAFPTIRAGDGDASTIHVDIHLDASRCRSQPGLRRHNEVIANIVIWNNRVASFVRSDPLADTIELRWPPVDLTTGPELIPVSENLGHWFGTFLQTAQASEIEPP